MSDSLSELQRETEFLISQILAVAPSPSKAIPKVLQAIGENLGWVVGNFWKFLYEPQIGLFNYPVSFVTGVDRSSFQMLGDVALAPWAIVIVDVWMWTPYVMLICVAGLRSIPDYIYEAAEVDRASPWRQFWSITLPMALPFVMLAVLFRGIENFRCSTW